MRELLATILEPAVFFWLEKASKPASRREKVTPKVGGIRAPEDTGSKTRVGPFELGTDVPSGEMNLVRVCQDVSHA